MICWIFILMVVIFRVVDSFRVRLIRWIVRYSFCIVVILLFFRKIIWLVCSIIVLRKLYRYCFEIFLVWKFFFYSYLYNLYNEIEKVEILVSIMLIYLGIILKFFFFFRFFWGMYIVKWDINLVLCYYFM